MSGMIYGSFSLALKLSPCANGETVEARLLIGEDRTIVSTFGTRENGETADHFRVRMLADLLQRVEREATWHS